MAYDGVRFDPVPATAAGSMHHRQIPLIHPDRQPLRFNVFKALTHFSRFKLDKEKTREAFHIFEALPWKGFAEAACAFLVTERGQAIFTSEPWLPEILDDHAALRRLPKGSLAHDYCDHMEREELSAAGLVAEYGEWRGNRVRLDDQVEWYADRLRDTHDLLHVLTGFGRDILGELSVLTYVYQQRPSRGHLFLGYAGALTLRLRSTYRAPVMRAVHEARQLGKACLPIAEQPVRELLAMPTEAVRERLNVLPARYYHEVRRVWREEGIEPVSVLAKQAVG